jgi:hypothetical protein
MRARGGGTQPASAGAFVTPVSTTSSASEAVRAYAGRSLDGAVERVRFHGHAVRDACEIIMRERRLARAAMQP